MGIVTRPVKPVGGGGTAEWINGVILLANELNEDIKTIIDDYNGNVSDANCAAGMALKGTKIADAPNGIPAGKYNALSIRKGDLSTTTGQKITSNQLEELIEEKSFSINIAPSFTLRWGGVHRVTVGANYEAVVAIAVNLTGSDVVTWGNVAVVPTTAIPTTSRDLIDVYLADLATSSPNVIGKVVFVSRAKS